MKDNNFLTQYLKKPLFSKLRLPKSGQSPRRFWSSRSTWVTVRKTWQVMRWWSRWSPSWCWSSTSWTRSRGSGSAGRPRPKPTRTGPRWALSSYPYSQKIWKKSFRTHIENPWKTSDIQDNFFFIFSSLIPLSVFRYRSGSGSLSMRSRLKKHKRIEKGNAVRRRRGSRKSKTLTNRGNSKRKRTGKSIPMTLNQW